MDEGTRTGRAGQEGKGIEKGGENSDFLSPSEGVQTNGAMRVGPGLKTLFQIFVAIKLRVYYQLFYIIFLVSIFLPTSMIGFLNLTNPAVTATAPRIFITCFLCESC